MALVVIVFGLVALLGIGITGIFILLVGAALAGVASIAATRSKAATLLALCTDAAVGALAGLKLYALATGATVVAGSGVASQTTRLDWVLPVSALVLVAAAFLGVAADWRQVRKARWF